MLGKEVFIEILHLLILCVQSREPWWVGKSEDSVQKYTIFFCSVGLGGWTHITGFGGK